MVLKKREIILVVVVAAFLVIVALYWLWPSQGASLAELRAKRDNLAKQEQINRNKVQKAKKVEEHLAEWQRRALPADPETARSLYQDWLRKLVAREDFRNFNITPLQGQSPRDAYTMISYTITCQATLEQLTKFLYEFYSVGFLHKIRFLMLTPQEKSSILELTITVEALSLPDSTQKDKLPTQPGKRLKLASLETYKNSIVSRNLFAPPKSTTDKDKERDAARRSTRDSDPARSTFLTGIIHSNGTPEAWLYIQSTGETFKLHEGEEFIVGSVHGKVIRIDRLEIDVRINGKNHTLSYGDSLIM